MKVNPEYHYLLDEWCPLFGPLPLSGGAPSSLLTRCVNIIIEARDIWEVPFCGGIPGYNNPSLKEISESLSSLSTVKYDYPEELIISARVIYETFGAVCEHTIINDPLKDYYRRDDGTVKPVNTIVSVWERAVEDSRDFLTSYLRTWGFDNAYDIEERIPDHSFLAIFAISEAWHVLQCRLYYGESEDDLLIRDQVQEATELLAKAKSMVDTETITKMQPHAKRGIKIQSAASEGGKTTVQKIREERAPLWKEEQEEAVKIWQARPDLPKSSVAELISKRLGGKPGTIRKRIKKPTA